MSLVIPSASGFTNTARWMKRPRWTSRWAWLPLALAIAGGVLLGLGAMLAAHPDRDDGATSDEVTEGLLRLFGMPAKLAHKICTRPLPDIDAYA